MKLEMKWRGSSIWNLLEEKYSSKKELGYIEIIYWKKKAKKRHISNKL